MIIVFFRKFLLFFKEIVFSANLKLSVVVSFIFPELKLIRIPEISGRISDKEVKFTT